MPIDRSNLRLSDLKKRKPEASRMMNVKISVDTFDAIDKLAKQLKTSKTSVIVALLNEALAIAGKGKR